MPQFPFLLPAVSKKRVKNIENKKNAANGSWHAIHNKCLFFCLSDVSTFLKIWLSPHQRNFKDSYAKQNLVMTVLLLITSLALVKDHTFPSFLPPHPIITLYDIQNVCFRLSLYFDMMSEPAQLGVYLEVFISGDHFSSSQMPPIYHATVLLMPAHSSPSPLSQFYVIMILILWIVPKFSARDARKSWLRMQPTPVMPHCTFLTLYFEHCTLHLSHAIHPCNATMAICHMHCSALH